MSSLILTRIFLAAAGVFGGLSVAGGAFASHALKDRLTDRALAIFETGARYQMYHALALLLVALLLPRPRVSSLLCSSWMGFYCR